MRINNAQKCRFHLWLCVFAFVAGGCGDKLATVPARGVVVYNGEPVEGAYVSFIRDGVGEQGPAGTAITDSQGQYELKTDRQKGILPGKYAIIVYKDNSESLNIPDPLPEGMTRFEYMNTHNLHPRPLLPIRYSRIHETPFHVEVTSEPASNYFELRLEGPLPAAPRDLPPRLP